MGGEHGTWQKTLFFEAASRVPMIIRWPGVVKAGTRSNEITGLIDIFPTLCEAAGLEIPETCEGIGLYNHLAQEKPIEREGIFSESAVLRATDHAGCMYRTGHWKYCYYLDGNEELYNLLDDPDELKNVAQDNPEITEQFRMKVISFWKPEDYLSRLAKTPIMSREKHFYPYSNQFVTGDGRILDARP